MEYSLFDTQIYSNYGLNFPHKRVRSLKEFDNIPNDDKRKIFLGDDFEYWFNSRSTGSIKNKSLTDILLFFGKKNISLTYVSKREMAIDKSLRESTMEFWDIKLKQKYIHPDKNKNNILKNYLNFLYIQIERYDDNLDPLPTFRINNLQYITPLFNTKEIIQDLQLNHS